MTEEKTCLGINAFLPPSRFTFVTLSHWGGVLLTAQPKHLPWKHSPCWPSLVSGECGDRAPMGRSWAPEQPLCLVKSKSPLSKAESMNEWEGSHSASGQGEGFRVSATLAMRFVRARWGQEALVMGSWEQVTAQHYKGNPTPRNISPPTSTFWLVPPPPTHPRTVWPHSAARAQLEDWSTLHIFVSSFQA